MKSSTVFFGIQMNWLAMFAGVFCLTLAMGASAGEKTGPCAEDLAKFCKDVEKDRVVQCIKEHKRKKELSPVCTQALDNAEKYSTIEKNEDFVPACADDIKAHCKGMPVGSGRVANCLKEHENEIDSECKDMLK
jgi:hypothetical protein